MTIFDYILRDYGGELYKDEYDNAYIACSSFVGFEYIKDVIYTDNDTYFIPKEIYEKYLNIEIAISDDDSINKIELTRRPYYRMRGKSVTEEQAFDIIRKTDNFFRFKTRDIAYHNDFIACLNFDNWLIERNHSPWGYGWIHVDGTIGGNAITQKYPDLKEFILEWVTKLVAFPYLDLIIAVTYWDEYPPEVFDNDNEMYLFYTSAYDKKFYDAIEVGIYVHDNKVEILNHHDTVLKYKEYDKLYGNPREKFEPDYYERNGVSQITMSYLRRCIESYGLDADEVLSHVQKYIIKGIPD